MSDRGPTPVTPSAISNHPITNIINKSTTIKMEKILFNDINYTLGKLSEEERARFDGSTVLITGCAGFLGY